jgi:tetratricopeptide (TPR) repeat protein
MSVTRIRSRVVLVALLAGLLPGTALAQGSAEAYFEFLMARRLETAGDIDAALAALERAEAADPTSAEIKAEIAAFHLRRDPPRREEGERAAQAALAIDEDNVEANRQLGFLYYSAVENSRNPAQRARDRASAILHLERAAAGTPGSDANLLYMLGRLYLANGDAAKAVESLTRVAAQSSNSVQARIWLARAYAAADDLPSAIGTLQEVVQFLPNVAGELGAYQEEAGLLMQAAASYTVALLADPDNAQLKIRRLNVLYGAKEYAQAAALAAEARTQHPDEPAFPQLQARALFDAGDRSAAIAVAESTARSFPEDVATQWVLVGLYSDAGRDDDVEDVLRQILEEEPSNPQAMNHLGYLLARRGEDLDEAIGLVRRALDRDPNNAAYLDSLGWAYFKRGDFDQAQKYLNAAAEGLPENSEIQDHLGDLHARRGQWQAAIDAWTRALGGDGQDVDREAIQRKVQDARRELAR